LPEGAQVRCGSWVAHPITLAGVATLLTNALPIAAGTIVLNEAVPWEELGVTSELSPVTSSRR
jgi:hypothetical protein